MVSDDDDTMLRAGGSRSSLKLTAGKCSVRAHSNRSPDQAFPFAPPNAIQVPSPGWKKQGLMQEMSKTLKSLSSNLLERFIDTAYRFSEQHSLNEGNFQPVDEIGEVVLLNDLSGEVPEDFPEGVYIRNGPNPLHPTQTIADSIFGSTSYMYYEGHGMLHAVYFNKSSQGEWKISYRNKFVDSDTFQLEREKNEVAFVPSVDGQPYAILVAFVLNILRFGKAVKDSANTNIFEHAGRAFAVTENHLPYEIDINNLNTLGPYNINGAWSQPFTSHPKKIHRSGDLVIMGTNTEKPHYVLGVISSDGERLLHKVDLKFEEGKLIHDIGVTTRYNIIMDYPLRFGISRPLFQKPFIENDMNGKSRIGVMPRFGDAESIMWFDVENHCSYHLFNCFEDGNEVVVRGCRILGSVIPSGHYRVDNSNDALPRGSRAEQQQEGRRRRMTIRFVLFVNKQGQTRLAQYYEHLSLDERRALEGEIVRKCLARTDQQCSFVEHRNYKVVYRRYASLFFLVGVDNDENELATLEFIHLLVETMDRHFGNVCELDIMFHLEKVHFMLEEMVMNGCIVETSKQNILAPIQLMEKAS